MIFLSLILLLVIVLLGNILTRSSFGYLADINKKWPNSRGSSNDSCP